MSKIITLTLGLTLAGALSASAAVPGLLNFQGRLLDSNKLPRNGDFLMSFKICNSLAATCSAPCAVGNACLWTESQTVTVTNGVFAVQLGAAAAIDGAVFSADTRYLEIAVAGETLSPRERLTAGPYSFKTSVADALTDNDGSALLRISSVAVGAINNENQIADGIIGNADINPAAAIAISKLATTGTLGANVIVSSLAVASANENVLSLSDTVTGNVSTLRHGFAPKASGSTTQFLRGDAAWAPVSTMKFVVKGADENVPSGTTLQNDDALSFAVAAGETWIFDFRLLVSNNNSATPDWKSAVLGATGWTCRVTLSGSEPLGTAFPQVNTTDCDAAPTAVTNATISADAGVPFNVSMQGWITATTAGTVTLQWAPNTSGSLTVLAGSYVIAQKVGGI